MNLSLILLLLVGILTLCLPVGSTDSAQSPLPQPSSPFIHPGLLHSRQDLERIKKAVTEKQEPIFAGYEVLRNHPQSQATYTLHGPLAMVGRNPTVGQGEYDSDANAAYQCALLWSITGDRAYADKSRQILNAWSSTLKSITGRDAVLMAGLGPFKMMNAAEILRYTDSGWTEADTKQAERHFKEVIYPVLKDFALFANGNWDTAAIKTVMAIGVFCNDRNIFERGLRYYVNGAGDGRLTHYIINEVGQCQESGRDMPHTQLGLAHLGDCCEIAWNQGLDLYGVAENRLLRGFEYTARYNLGEDVPFTETRDRTGKYHHTTISTMGRGRLRPVFEQIYNHYAHRRGIPAPYTRRAAEQLRPEGPAQPGADHPGFGTLLYTRPTVGSTSGSPPVAPAPPAGLIASGARTGNLLTWVPSVAASGYTIKRASVLAGPYTTIAQDLKAPTYTDTSVTAGTLYYYTVSATNTVGTSPDAFPFSICASLPSPWTHQDIGGVMVPGDTNYDGNTFTLEGEGSAIGGASDQLHLASVPLMGDGTIIARFVPQVSSQFSQFGLMIRAGLGADSAHVATLLTPEGGGNVEAPGWNVRLVTRATTGAETSIAATSPNLAAPYVTYGRLMEPCWLRLTRTGNTFTAAFSPDGTNWTSVGETTVSLTGHLQIGLCACSRLNGITTTVRFDHVTVPDSSPPVR